LMMRDKEEILGALIMNQTGMHEYIPSNILVYVAVHSKTRGQGLGKQLVQEAIQSSEGGIALHVEPNNPAKFLYEKLGFTNKYLEMRLI
jgi:[ribosomal protein S18]-alanine N-acetyltransferase